MEVETKNVTREVGDFEEIPYSNGEAVYEVVSANDERALKFLLRRIRTLSRAVPPFDDAEKNSAALVHIWDVIVRKTRNDTSLDAVLGAALAGRFDYLPYEVKNRLIDDARAASAQRRGGDGKRLPVFESLTFEGQVETRRGIEDEPDDGRTLQRPTGGVIELCTRDEWLRITQDLRRQEATNDPAVISLGPAAKLYTFYLSHDDGYRWTDAEIACQLGVTDRTIRNYRRLVARFLRPGVS